MPATADRDGPSQYPPEELVRELMVELGTAFDLSTRIGRHSLGELVERRLRSLDSPGEPEWGTPGSLTQVAKKQSGALDFYYRPHLFPDMDAALRLGHRLQFDLLPRRLPGDSSLQLAVVLESYCHLSGDLLGWRLEDDELFLWIIDVSGHGVRAGLAAATLYFLINSVEVGLSPAEFARRVNDGMLAAKNSEETRALFATAIWLRAKPSGQTVYASSGHNPTLLRRSSGDVEYLGSTGQPLGLFPGQSYDERRFLLEDSDGVFLFTDGLIEAQNPEDEEFGIQRLADLEYDPGASPIDLTRQIYEAVRAHLDTRLLDDDLTFMVIQQATEF